MRRGPLKFKCPYESGLRKRERGGVYLSAGGAFIFKVCGDKGRSFKELNSWTVRK